MTDWEAKYRRLENALFNSAYLAEINIEKMSADDDRSYFTGYYAAMSKVYLAATKIASEAEEMTDWEAKYRRLENALFNSACLAGVNIEKVSADDDRSYLTGYYVALSKVYLAAVKIATEVD